MPTITALRGFPGSGKTTLTERVPGQSDPVKGERPSEPAVVSRDDIRASLFKADKTYFDFSTEQMITKIAQAQVRALIKSGHDVVIDDTNLRQKYLVEWARLAIEVGADFRIEDVKVDDVYVLLNRNHLRGNPLTEERLRDLWARFPQGRWPSLETIMAAAVAKGSSDRSWTPYAAPKRSDFPDARPGERMWDVAYLVDIDGTLARNDGHRGWHEYDKVGGDVGVYEIVRIINSLHRADSNVRIIFMSGRKDSCRDQTRAWLADWVGDWTQGSPLFMRDADDNRPDDIVKHELFHEHIQGRYRVLAAFDDRNRVVDMWRAIGLTCLQVAPGDF